LTSTFIGLAVLALILVNQLRARPLDNSPVLPLILAVIGLLEFGVLFEGGVDQFQAVVKGQHAFVFPSDTRKLLIALTGSLVLAAIGAGVRVPTFRLWRQDGRVWRKGRMVTAVLWIASLGAHLGYDAWVGRDSDLAQLGSVTMLLYFAITLGIQRLFLGARASRLRNG
jgi:hypothetical protein